MTDLLNSITTLTSILKISYGPNGSDQLIVDKSYTITNDGCTIFNLLKNDHFLYNILKSAVKTQEMRAGDGTTSLLLLIGSLAHLLHKYKEIYHPVVLAEQLQNILIEFEKYFTENKIPITDKIKENIFQNIISSKLIYQYSENILPLLNIVQKNYFYRKAIGSIEDIFVENGFVVEIKNLEKITAEHRKMENLRIACIQFSLAPPKPNLDNDIHLTKENVNHIVEEEKNFLIKILKNIRKEKINYLFIQRNLLQTNSELLLYLLNKYNILYSIVDRDVFERVTSDYAFTPSYSIENIYAHNISCTINSDTIVMHNPEISTINIYASDIKIADEIERNLEDLLAVKRNIEEEPYAFKGAGIFEREFAECLTGKINFKEAFLEMPYYLNLKGEVDEVYLSTRVIRTLIEIAVEVTSTIVRVDEVLPGK